MSDIQDYFEYIIKKHEAVTDNPSIMIYVNKIENRIKPGYYLELLIPETVELLWSFKSKITKDENSTSFRIYWSNISPFNIISNNYQPVYKSLTCISNKSFGQLLDLSRKNFMLVKTFNSEFSYIEVWFTNQFSKPLEIENKINNTLVII